MNQERSRIQKEVIFRTPVLLGNQDIQEVYESKKVKYLRDAVLHDGQVPVICNELPTGIIIDLPTEKLEEYAAQYLQWLHLDSDELLVDGLHKYILSTRTPNNPDKLSL